MVVTLIFLSVVSIRFSVFPGLHFRFGMNWQPRLKMQSK